MQTNKRKARVARCYTDQVLVANTDITLDKRSSHHLSTVLRARVGTQVQLFNGDGKNYQGEITATGKKTSVSISSAHTSDNESSLYLTLVQAIARGDKMDGIIQKATELGVSQIQPIYTAQSIAKLELKREQKKREHWHSIMLSACEQCGRCTLPSVQPILSLSQFLELSRASAPDTQRWILSPSATPTVTEQSISSAMIMVGPESGFDNDEVQVSEAAGFTALQLGPRVLRTETAGPAAIAILQSKYGDIL